MLFQPLYHAFAYLGAYTRPSLYRFYCERRDDASVRLMTGVCRIFHGKVKPFSRGAYS